jgi:hypothetical protein
MLCAINDTQNGYIKNSKNFNILGSGERGVRAVWLLASDAKSVTLCVNNKLYNTISRSCSRNERATGYKISKSLRINFIL